MSNKPAEQILWHLPNPILVLNDNFQVEYVNAAFETMLGISLKTILKKNIHEVGLEMGDGWKEFLQKLEGFIREDGDSLKNKKSMSHKNLNVLFDPLMPKKLFGHYQNTQVFALKDKVYYFEFFNAMDIENVNSLLTILFREITNDVEVTDQMLQAEKMSGLGTLAAGLAHELNNPLYSIIGLSEMIISESEKENINSKAKRIIENSKKMVSVVENLAVYSQSNISKDREIVNLNERLDAASELALLADHSKIINIDRDYCSMAFIRARPEEIEQIFFNIFCNSIQAMKDKGDLFISTKRIDDENITVKIRDTGEGVPKEFVARVFDPFFTTKEQGEGTGLGLTAAYQLVKKYEGTIKFNSVQGEGTTVEILWPLKIEAGF